MRDASDERRIRFYVRDATGRVLIDPTDAELDLAGSGTRFDPAQRTASARTRTLGHRHQEQSLAVGTPVYILGCVVDGQGQPMIARSPKDHKFIISRRSERELAGAAASAVRYWYYGASGAGALGLVLLVIGIVT